jgi:hypothetical protein
MAMAEDGAQDSLMLDNKFVLNKVRPHHAYEIFLVYFLRLQRFAFRVGHYSLCDTEPA